MANYNYVAPIQYKSYSDMNKERLAAKAVKDSERIKQRSAGDKQKQQYLDQLSGLSTKNWATVFRDELTAYVKKAEEEFNKYGGMTGYDPGPMINGLMRLQDRGDSHAELYQSQLDYEAQLGPNAKNPKEDDWSAKFVFTTDGHAKRLKAYNYAGMIDYNEKTQLGYFPNPLYDPNASEGVQSKMTLKNRILEEGGTEAQDDRNFVITEDGERVQVIGKAFDSPAGGMGGLWNPDKIPVATHTAKDTFFNFQANDEGASVFKAQADELQKKVEYGGITSDEAHDDLYKTVLSFMTGQDPNASMIASAITKWELEHDNASWADVELARSQTDSTVELKTPFQEYAEAVADIPNLKKKPAGKDSSGATTASGRLWGSILTNKYRGVDEASTGRATEDEAIKNAQWTDMLVNNLGDEWALPGYNIQTIMDQIRNSDQDNLNITITEGGIKYDGQDINRVTYIPEFDYVIIWRVDPEPGTQGPLPANSAWAYTKAGLGDEPALDFQVIYMHQDGIASDDANMSQQYRELRANFAWKLQDGSGFDDPLGSLFDRAAAGN